MGDIQWPLKPALRHRIAGNYAAQANNRTSDQLLDMLLAAVPADRNNTGRPGGLKRHCTTHGQDDLVPLL